MTLRHFRTPTATAPPAPVASVGIPVLCAVLGLAAGYVAISRPHAGLVLLGAAAVTGLAARQPVALALAAGPASFDTARLSIGHGIALPDLVLLAATILCLPALARLGTPDTVRRARRWFAVYGVAMAAVVALHPSGRSAVEALHRSLLVAGALSVGAWIHAEGHTRLALRLIVITAALAGAACVLAGAVHGFRQPAQPLGLQKNYLGAVTALALLLRLTAADEIDLEPTVANPVAVIIAGGLAATHSRSSMLALALGLIVWLLRNRTAARRRGLAGAVLLAACFLGLCGYLIDHQLSNRTATENTNSIAVRTKTEDATRALWRTSPVDGVGIYYYEDPAYPARNRFLVAPDNVVDEALAEGGVILAGGLVIFEVGGLVTLARCANPLAASALALVSARLLQGMFDIYWTAGDASLPWVVAGMALAQAATRPSAPEPVPAGAEPAR